MEQEEKRGDAVMREIQWEVQYLALPPVRKYCKKCNETMQFVCSGRFRVNAQKKRLDVWLIYRCSGCDTVWNAALYTQIHPDSLPPGWLEGFSRNDPALVERFVMDTGLLRKNGAEPELPSYSILGETFSPEETVLLTIKSGYSMPLKVAAILKEKLGWSRRELEQRIARQTIRSIPECDLSRCRLQSGIVLLFCPDAEA